MGAVDVKTGSHQAAWSTMARLGYMGIQAITHTGPCHPPSIASEIPGNGHHWVRLSTGSLRGHLDCRRVTVTAKFDIGYVFRGLKIKAERLIGKIGYGLVFLASKYYCGFRR